MDNCSILITVPEIIRCAIQHASLDVALVIAVLSSVRLCEPSLARGGCYLFCHAHTSAAHREEVSMQGTWLIEGTEARCAQLRLPVNTKDASQETLLSASTPLEKSRE